MECIDIIVARAARDKPNQLGISHIIFPQARYLMLSSFFSSLLLSMY